MNTGIIPMIKEDHMSIAKLTELIVSGTNPQLALAAITAANYKPDYLSAATVDRITAS